jgi:hypothetical protein
MRKTSDRAVLKVLRRDGQWLVELEGEVMAQSTEKEVSQATANRLARRLLDEGRPCEVRVWGEFGYYGAV